MWTKPSYLKRFWMGFFIQYAAQSTGAQVIYGSPYPTTLLSMMLKEDSLHRIPLPKPRTDRRRSPHHWCGLCHRGHHLELHRRTLTRQVWEETTFQLAPPFNMIAQTQLTRIPVAGLAGCMLSVALETTMIATYAGTTNQAGLSMGVFFSFCFISFYGGGIDVVGYVYCGEPSFLFPPLSIILLSY